MEGAALQALVTDLINESFDGGDKGVAERLLRDADDTHGEFAGFCERMSSTVSGPSESGVRQAWTFLLPYIDDRMKARIGSGEIRSPAVYLGALL